MDRSQDQSVPVAGHGTGRPGPDDSDRLTGRSSRERNGEPVSDVRDVSREARQVWLQQNQAIFHLKCRSECSSSHVIMSQRVPVHHSVRQLSHPRARTLHRSLKQWSCNMDFLRSPLEPPGVSHGRTRTWQTCTQQHSLTTFNMSSLSFFSIVHKLNSH